MKFSLKDLALALAMLCIGFGGLLAPQIGVGWMALNNAGGWTDDWLHNTIMVIDLLGSSALIGAALGTPFRKKFLGACLEATPAILWMLAVFQLAFLDDGR